MFEKWRKVIRLYYLNNQVHVLVYQSVFIIVSTFYKPEFHCYSTLFLVSHPDLSPFDDRVQTCFCIFIYSMIVVEIWCLHAMNFFPLYSDLLLSTRSLTHDSSQFQTIGDLVSKETIAMCWRCVGGKLKHKEKLSTTKSIR